MNKMKISKMLRESNRPEGLRVIFRKRNNYKEKYEQTPRRPNSRQTLQDTTRTHARTVTQSIDQVRSFVKNRLKTQYSHQFQGLKAKQRNTLTPKHHQGMTAFPTKSVKTFDCVDNQSETSSLDISKTNFKVDDQFSFVGAVQGLPESSRDPQFMDRLEENLDSRVQKRLQKCLQFNKTSDWDSQSDMGDLITAVKWLKTEGHNPQTNEDIEFSDKKISMFEKLMASKVAQSEILKKYYFSKISNPSRKPLKSTSLYSIDVSKSPAPFINRKESVVLTSANKTAFQRPEKSAYLLQRRGKEYFSVDRHLQPLPRSSYGRQYLNYRGYVPPPATQPVDSSVMKNASSSRVVVSAYKRQFGRKKTDNINPKELDAYRNKIRNLPISFGKREKDQIFAKISTYLSNRKITKTQERTIDIRFPRAAMLSESRKEYIKCQPGPPSRIKHENVNKMKYQYKSKYHV